VKAIIHKALKKIKEYRPLIAISSTGILLICASFFSGQIYGFEQIQLAPQLISDVALGLNQSKMTVEEGEVIPAQKEVNQTPNWAFAASARGRVYYSRDCEAHSSISVENKVFFDTLEAVEAAGYTRSKQC
jgi:hypothetical protein